MLVLTADHSACDQLLGLLVDTPDDSSAASVFPVLYDFGTSETNSFISSSKNVEELDQIYPSDR
jgi:hypothetical protein